MVVVVATVCIVLAGCVPTRGNRDQTRSTDACCSAGRPKANPIQTQPSQSPLLDGVWQVVGVKLEGRELTSEEVETLAGLYIFAGGKLTIVNRGIVASSEPYATANVRPKDFNANADSQTNLVRLVRAKIGKE